MSVSETEDVEISHGNKDSPSASSDSSDHDPEGHSDSDSEAAESDQETFIAVSRACQNGDVDLLKELIDGGNSVDVSDSRGWFPMHEAAAAGYAKCLEVLLEQEDCDVLRQTYDGKTALFLAAQSGHLNCVETLLDRQADPNVTDDDKNTPLSIAIYHQHSSCAEVLIEVPQNNDALHFSNAFLNTPLAQAVTDGNTDLCRLLLAKGCDPCRPVDYGLTPIFIAAQFGHLQCLKELIPAAIALGTQSPWDIPAEDGATPLYIAAQGGHVECVKYLLDCGADPTLAEYSDQNLPLCAAVFMEKYECVEVLWKARKASVWERLQPDLLETAILCEGDSEPERMVKLLFQLGWNPDLRIRVKKMDLQLGPHIFYTYLISNFGALLGFDYESVSMPCVALAFGKEDKALLVLQQMAVVEPDPDECPMLYFAIKHSIAAPRFLTELMTGRKVQLNYYRSDWLVGNLTVFLCLSRPRALLELLKCGVEVDSLFGTAQDSNNPRTALAQLLNSPSFSNMAAFDNNQHRAKTKWSKAVVVRILLEFTKNVRLDPSLQNGLTQSQWTKLTSVTDNTYSLEHLCRHRIRQCLGTERLRSDEHVRTLGLPKNVASYLLFEDVAYEDFVKLMEDG